MLSVRAFGVMAVAIILLANPLVATEDLEDVSSSSFLEVEDNPSYTLPYPAITYAAHAAGGFFHPYSNVNPLQTPWAGFAPVAGPAHVGVYNQATLAASPISAYLNGGVHPYLGGAAYAGHHYASALGINTAIAAGGDALHASTKGGYNVHGIMANHMGYHHPGLSADLTSLGGKYEPAESLMEVGSQTGQSHSQSLPAASDHDPADVMADAENVAYGLFPAPTPATPHFLRSRYNAMIGPHKLNFASVGDNEVDEAFPALVEVAAESETEAEAEAEAEAESIEDGACVNCVFD